MKTTGIRLTLSTWVKFVPVFAIWLGIGATYAQQVKETTFNRDGSGVVLAKEIPVVRNLEITGDGTPQQMLYVVQLARFVDLPYIPEKFPKGCMLFISPDHPSEKLLLNGFYDSYEKAQQAAAKWKKIPEFKGAFVRKSPLLIRYD